MSRLRRVAGTSAGTSPLVDTVNFHLGIDLIVAIDTTQEDPSVRRYLYPDTAEGRFLYETKLQQENLRGERKDLGQREGGYLALAAFYLEHAAGLGIEVDVVSNDHERIVDFEGRKWESLRSAVHELDRRY